MSVFNSFNFSINFIIEERFFDKLSIFLLSREILANFDICFTVSLSIDICDYWQISWKIAFKMETHNILSIDEFKTNVGNNSRLLGIDPGGKNVGIAICDENKKVATPLKSILKTNFQFFLNEIKEIIEENNIKGLVVGNPINMDGTKGKSAQSVNDFAKNLSKNVTIPIVLWDERLSSEGSFKITTKLGSNVSNRVKKLDKNAAAFILQGAIDFLTN